MAPFQEPHAAKLIHAVLEARSGTDDKSISHGDMFFLNDCGKSGLTNRILNLFKWASEAAEGEKKTPVKVKRKSLVISYNEQSARARKKNTRSFTGLNHMEILHVFTKTDIDLPSKAKRHFAGTNQGQTFENVLLPGLGDLWTLEVKTKKQIYGSRRFRPGGPGDDDEDEDDAEDDVDSRRTDETKEPVFYNTMTFKTVDECAHSFCLSAIIDLSVDCGDKAVMAIANGLMYTGTCLTETHMDLVKWRIMEKIFYLFIEEGQRLYNPKLASLVQEFKGTAKPTPKARCCCNCCRCCCFCGHHHWCCCCCHCW
jgi:hypothetical protein